MVDLSLGNIVKNAFFLFLACLPRTLLSAVLQAAYWVMIWLFMPYSFFAFAAGFWLPCLLGLMPIYPVLDDRFQIEQRIQEVHKANDSGRGPEDE